MRIKSTFQPYKTLFDTKNQAEKDATYNFLLYITKVGVEIDVKIINKFGKIHTFEYDMVWEPDYNNGINASRYSYLKLLRIKCKGKKDKFDIPLSEIIK